MVLSKLLLRYFILGTNVTSDGNTDAGLLLQSIVLNSIMKENRFVRMIYLW